MVRDGTGALRGVEAVVDKDLTAALLAQDLAADALVILTDVDAVEDGYGTPQARPIHRATPQELRTRNVPGRLHGPEGGGRLPVRGGDGRDGRDRPGSTTPRRSWTATAWHDPVVPADARCP